MLNFIRKLLGKENKEKLRPVDFSEEAKQFHRELDIPVYRRKIPKNETYYPLSVPDNIDKKIPDSPVSFGYKCMWFAIKTGNKQRLVEIFQLKNVTECNWLVGIDHAYNGSIFITPLINQWTLVCGWGLPHGDTKESLFDVKTILKILSKEFDEAQFFCTHRVTEFQCWIKATEGQVERVYSFLGESAENISVEGIPTLFEQTLTLINTLSEEAKSESYLDQEDLIWPDEELLMEVAENWSVNPTKLADRTDVKLELGILGK